MVKEIIEKKIKNRVVLITGGTGSFGNSVIGTLLKLGPKRIIIFSRDEKKQEDMRNAYDSPLLQFVIGDVRDETSVDRVMERVDYVFHAAALKQVPTCEFFPIEAVKTNIIGADNVIHAAIKHGVKRLVILSTDKAIYPINAMGMSKAIMEKVMIAASKRIVDGQIKETVLCGVRYGNVLYTRGSVLPYFVSLIRQGKKLRVTHPDMTRFLLPLTDAVDLVLFALINGEIGYMYVRKSPAATIEALAKAVCKIFNYKKGYEVVGIRAGEKMHETLITKEELLRVQDLGDYYKIPPETQGLDYGRHFKIKNKLSLERVEPYTSFNTRRLNIEQTAELLLTLPEIQEELRLFHQ